MSSRDNAKEAVDSIGRKFGFVGDDILGQIEQWRPDIRRIIEESMLAKDRLAAHSIKTLAKNIYGSDARFVFELLQNADDNRFRRARDLGQLPSVSFLIHPDRIVVECNEDGFTKQDLSAICAVGESTKSASHGYIGAKGIGFKSVFIAAWMVYIQSGYFSFFFRHEKGDLGLGMVLPVWKDAEEELPGGPLTRMTLHLHQNGDQNELQHLRETIFQQLDDLQETCLLFLRNLKRIRVSFYQQDGGLKSTKVFSVGKVHEHRVFIKTKSRQGNGSWVENKKYYHVTKHMASNLSRSDNREIPDTEEARRSYSTAEVVLAFPLTIDSKPHIEKQHVFAFLPIRESSFTFLIQSDFDTSASRQDIIATSRRNTDLLDGIATAFIKAVKQFCEHPDPVLCYTWPMFLPRLDDNASHFWDGLIKRIQQLVSETPILRGRHSSALRKIGDIKLLARDARDSENNPLFDDPISDPFLSDAYPSDSKTSLRPYGLVSADFQMLLDLLQADLNTPESRMKSPSTSQGWHSAVARLFSSCFHNRCFRPLSRLKTLPLLPLRTGAWVAATAAPVYWPMTGNIPIPPAIDIPVIDPGAISNHDRRALFTHLHVVESSVSRVRNAILKAYEANDGRVDVAESRAHLHYLYLTSQHNQPQIGPGGIYVWDHWTQCADPRLVDVFLPSDHPYGPDALLQAAGDAPGLAVAFLHPTYLEDVPQPLATSNLSWKRWLVNFLGVRDKLRLVSRHRHRDCLSSVWFYVAEHRPEKLLGLLEHLWRHEGSRYIGGNDSLKEEIRDMSADMLCGFASEDPVWLCDTWLPLPPLQRQCLRFMEGSEPFPFLKLEETMAAEQLSAKWMFLHTNFSVGMAEDTDFFLDILRWIQRANPDAPSLSRPQRVLDLYLAIEAKCLGAADQQRAERKRVRDTFASAPLVLVPFVRSCLDDGIGDEEQWAELSICRWEGPPNMTTKIPLEPAYTQEYGPDQTALLSRFFQTTLSIRGVSWEDVAVELGKMRRDGDHDFECILGLYRYLSDLRIIAFIDELRERFETERLIFAFKNGEPGWYKTSECLWSSTAEIRGTVTLNDHYDELKDFFVDTLGVKTLTLRMVYDELCNVSPQRGVAEIKNIIWSLNALLQTEHDRLDPEPLRKAHIFPVRYPTFGGVIMILQPANTEFAIVDRDHLAARFRDRIKLLDYTLEEVRRLKPFLQWVNLEQRYLSASVKEITSFQDGPTRPISMPNRNLNRKAHALLRIAATFNSPCYRSAPATLQHLFRTIQVRETDGISSELSISQDGRAVTVQEAVGNLYISAPLSWENTSSFAGGAGNRSLTIYVPADKTEQDFCFGSPLPASLARWLMTDPTTQIEDTVDSALVTALTTLLAVDGAVVDRVLEHQGIVQLPPFEEENVGAGGEDGREQVVGEEEEDYEEEEGEEEEAEEEEEEDNAAEAPDGDAPSSQWPTTADSSINGQSTEAPDTPGTWMVEPDDDGQTPATPQDIVRQSRLAHRPSLGRTTHSAPVLPMTPPLVNAVAEDTQYRALLDRVVAAARVATFPSRGAFDMSGLRDTLPGINFAGFDGLDAVNRFRSSSQLERDKKIGAAGELYAFETLSRLNPPLPNWGWHNWPSTMRGYARAHPDYADMPPWSGRETADITYDDAAGSLTAMLIDGGYLERAEWRDERPRYFIEVKSTTGPCATRFFMGKNQYRRMRDTHAADGHSEVYMILRVSDIESSRPRMAVYLDPEQLQLEGRLLFTAETWSVVPGSGVGASAAS